jgi:MFS family permease
MTPHIPQNRRRGGWGLFDLLCFVAACLLIFPVALKISHHFEGHWRILVFCIFMFIVYPVVGIIFAVLLRRFFVLSHHRAKNSQDGDKPNDA